MHCSTELASNAASLYQLTQVWYATRKSMVTKRLFTVLVMVMAILFSVEACSWQKEPAQMKTERERKEQITAWKMLIGKRYQVRRAIDLRAAPLSRDTRGVGKGHVFTVNDLVLDETDSHAAAYALRLDAGGGAYIEVRDLERLIKAGSVVGMDSLGTEPAGTAHGKQRSAKEEPPTRPTELGDVHHQVRHLVSVRVSDLLRGDVDFEDLPMLMLIVGTLFSLIWALWHCMGGAKTLSFLGIFPLVYWLFLEFPGKLSLVPFLLLLLLLLVLLGVSAFVRFGIIVAGSMATAYVVHTLRHQTENIVLVAGVSLAVIVIVGILTFFLVKKTYGIEQRPRQE